MDGWTDGGLHLKDRIRVLSNKSFKVWYIRNMCPIHNI